MPSISLPLHSYELRAAQASTSRLLNCHVEALPPDAKTPALLNRAPGLPSWGTVGAGPIEGMYSDHGTLYVVSGGGFYTVTTGAVATLRGAVGSSSEIDIDSSLLATVIVSPPNAYSWTLASSTFAQITDADFTSRGAGDVEHLDGYMLFREPDTARFFSSDLNALTFDALMFATAEGASDELVGLKVDHRQVFLAGEKSCELWENTGVSGFPFERSVNGFIELGCLNGKTLAKIDNSVVWYASDRTVRRLDGLTPVRISTHAIEQRIKDEATLADLRGYTYTQDGHLLYQLRSNELCFIYDFTTQLWHERQSYGYDSWNWSAPCEFNGKVLVGSTVSNVIAELDPEVYADLGDTQVMEWTSQAVKAPPGSRRAYFDRVELVLEVGVGLTTGQGSNPQVMLSISDDSGRTWLALPTKTMGAIGKYRTRVTWSGLGSTDSPHGRVFRFSISDPVQVAVVDTILDYHG